MLIIDNGPIHTGLILEQNNNQGSLQCLSDLLQIYICKNDSI